VCSLEQTRIWSDTFTLFTHILQHTKRNWLIEYYFGVTLANEEKKSEAVNHFQQAALINPEACNVQHDYGAVLFNLGRYQEALPHFRRSLELAPPHDIDAFFRVAIALHKMSPFLTGAEKSRVLDEAWNALEHAHELDPQSEIILASLGNVRAEQDRFDEAIPLYRQAIDLCLARLGHVEKNSELAKTYAVLGNAYVETGKMQDALNSYREAIRLGPDDVHCLEMAARIAAMSPDPAVRSGTDAVTWAERAVNIDDSDPALLSVLAAAYAEMNRFPDAVTTAKRARKLAEAQQLDGETITTILHQLNSYEAGKPVRDKPPKTKNGPIK
jgi:tetratricopeptide (TPR) repeat protein